MSDWNSFSRQRFPDTVRIMYNDVMQGTMYNGPDMGLRGFFQSAGITVFKPD